MPAHAERIRDLCESDIEQARHRLRAIIGTIKLIEADNGKSLSAVYDYGAEQLLLDGTEF